MQKSEPEEKLERIVECTSWVKDKMMIYDIYWRVQNAKHLLNNVEFKSATLYDNYDKIKEFRLKLQSTETDDKLNYKILFLCSTTAEVLILIKWNLYIDGTPETYSDYQPVQNDRWYVLATNLIGLFRKQESANINIKFEVANHFKFDSLNILEDYEKMLNTGLHSDIIMRSIDGVEFPVHKAVLASRSLVLKAHFEHNTTESATNTVSSQFEGDVLKELLVFVYTDKASRADEFQDRLLAAADFYQLDRLKTICEQVLYQQLTAENVMTTLQLAELYSATWLKRKSLEFIMNGPGQRIKNSDGWSKLNVELFKDICDFIMQNK